VIGPVGGVRFTSFLQHLGGFPEPRGVAQAVARGPLASYGVTSLNIWIHEDFNELVCISTHGIIDSYDNPYQRVPLGFHAPITESFLTGASVILPLSEMMNAYPSLGLDVEYWEQVLSENGDGDVAQVPIVSSGSAIGMFAFLCKDTINWTVNDYAVLDAVAAGLGLWLSHPRSGVKYLVNNTQSTGLQLSLRQIEVLRLVSEGKSNSAIAYRLGYSQSTIKQELQRISRRLKVANRNEAVTRAIELNLMTTGNAVPVESDGAGIS